MKKNSLMIVSLFCLICLAVPVSASEPAARPDPFPVFPSLDANVAFWTEVFTHYPTTSGIIHDSTDLEIIYEVIQLRPADQPDARKFNQKRIKAAKAKYGNILKALSRKGGPVTAEEKRVAALWGASADRALFRRAKANIRCQIGQRNRFRAGLIRSGAYMDRIEAIFRSQGLPADLAYLPHVESSFDPKARSKYGAAGMWQFTRSTGRLFMTVNDTLDERWDPLLSAMAAARFLKQNYEELGSWPLAITAYNHGTAGMRRAKARLKHYEAIYQHYRSRSFKFASKNFYSEFLAAREVAKDHTRYFGHLAFDLPVKPTELVLDGYASLQDLSSYLRVDPGTLLGLNPALGPSVASGQKYVPRGYRLRLPVRAAQNIAALGSPSASRIFSAQQKPSRFYRVRRGDTIAKIARRHGLKPAALIAANQLNAKAVIYVNQKLRLPVAEQISG